LKDIFDMIYGFSFIENYENFHIALAEKIEEELMTISLIVAKEIIEETQF
jgi:hypothetical protein